MFKISPDLSLPIDALTETFAILAKRGSGKTYTAKVLVEEMVSAGLPVVVIDPIGVWWGLRAGADGESEGLPVTIFGGDHADIPLEETSGALIADVLIAERFPAVLDLSLLSKSASRRFMTDFAERLYHANREPLHLVLDEADSWAPQRAHDGGQRLLGAIEDLVRRGRARGLGLTLITQRPAVLNKDVLTQCEVLICLRMNGTNDVKAIDEWVRLHADDDEAKTLKSSLPSLPVGTAWVWSPGWLGILQKVAIRRLKTFDSSATPKAGQQLIVPRKLAPVDIARLGERIAASVEKQAQENPAQLRKKLAALEAQLAERPQLPPVEVIREVPVLAPDDAAQLRSSAVALIDTAQHILASLDSYAEAARERPKVAPKKDAAIVAVKTAEPTPRRAAAASEDTPHKTKPDNIKISGAQQRILNALAALETVGLARIARQIVAVWAGQSPQSSSFSNNLGALRSAGLVDYPSGGEVTLTDGGRAIADAVRPPQSVRELHQAWCQLLPRPKAEIVRFLAQHYPKAIERERIADSLGKSPTSSSFSNDLGALRSLGLIEYPAKGTAAAAPLLFPKGLKR